MIRIGNYEVGEGANPFIIAEMSGNHNGSLDRALRIVDAVAESGAQSLKLQTYTADTMTIDADHHSFWIDDEKSLWNGRSLHDLYEEAHTPWEWHSVIFERCRERGIVPFSSPFDKSAVDFLEDLNVDCYKIASFEITDLPLIAYAAAKQKPLIVSTGMATVNEIGAAVETARSAGCTDLLILKCTSNYPSSPSDANLLTISDMKRRFHCEVGLSDHTLGIGVSLAAVALGAVAVERHVTTARSEGGVDSAFSLEPDELQLLVRESVAAKKGVGRVSYGPTERELPSLQFRRSIYAVADIHEGDILTTSNIRIIRPSNGLDPTHFEKVLGRRARTTIRRGTPLQQDFIE
jgi:pseudaminic acid synthase